LLACQQAGRLAIIRRDGTAVRRLPQVTAWDSTPAWSPDGARLAFAGSSPTWLFTVRPDGTALRRVIAQEALSPAGSVSGAIAFAHRYDRYAKPASIKDGLYTIRPDGSRLRRLFGRYRGTGSQPDWSPDGKRVVFDASGQIFTIGAGGRGLRRLTAFTHELDISQPVWSPDGRYIAFGRGYDVYVMRANGRGLRRVVDAPSLLARPRHLPATEQGQGRRNGGGPPPLPITIASRLSRRSPTVRTTPRFGPGAAPSGRPTPRRGGLQPPLPRARSASQARARSWLACA
jgi:dipeptidyl aminopeptidase/acylaminoacyl peptidase